MSEGEKKRRGPIGFFAGRSRRFWIVVAVLVPISYLASFGPACWLAAHPTGGSGGPFTMTPTIMIVYWPLGWVAESKLESAGKLLRWWACVGMKSGHMLWVPAERNRSNWHAFIKEPRPPDHGF